MDCLSEILQVTTDGRILGEALASQVLIRNIPVVHIRNQCYVARSNVESFCDIIVYLSCALCCDFTDDPDYTSVVCV